MAPSTVKYVLGQAAAWGGQTARKWTFRGPSMSTSSGNWLSSYLNGIPSKNGDTFSQKSKQYWLLSLMSRVWCIMNMFPQAIAWIILFTKRFCNVFKMQFIRNYLANCFQYLDSSPQQCTLPIGPECQHCWRSCGFASPLPVLAPCEFILFPRLKITLKREVFYEITEIQLNTTW